MKRLFTILMIAVSIGACNDTAINTQTTTTDSTTKADSAAQNVVDTTESLLDKAKVLVDSTKNKMEKAADKVKDTTVNR